MSDVVALGDVNVDIIARFPAYPTRGENAIALSSAFHCGGSAANMAVSLAKLGVAVSLIARVGCDPWSSAATRTLEEAGVVLSGLQRDPEVMTGLMYIAVTPGGERTMLGDRGANAFTDPREVDDAAFRGARLFYLSGYALLAEPQRSAALLALKLARLHGLTVALDPGMNITKGTLEKMRELLPLVDILLPNLDEAQALTGLADPEDCLEALMGLGAETVALKLGRNGCLVGRGSWRRQVPAFPVAALDSTGAGDSFAAGFLAARLWGLGWHGAAILGNALGSAATVHVGGAAATSRNQEVLALLRDCRFQPGFEEHAEAVQEAVGYVERLSMDTD
jgi:ribokinase